MSRDLEACSTPGGDTPASEGALQLSYRLAGAMSRELSDIP